MKSIAFFALIICCLVLTNKAIAQQKRYTIQGFISDSASKKPLVNATVILLTNKIITYSNANGRFEIGNILAGKYQLSFDYLGNHPTVIWVNVPLLEDIKVELPSEENHLHDVLINSEKNLSLTEYNLQNHAVLDAKKLDILRGQTMGDMLKNMAGVSLLNSGPSISKPVIRGLHSNRISILNNGIKQEGQNWGADHGPEIDPFAINKLELIKGASGLQYGPDAIGGVIKVSAKDFKQTNGLAGLYSLSSKQFVFRRQSIEKTKFELAISNQLSQGWRFKNSRICS